MDIIDDTDDTEDTTPLSARLEQMHRAGGTSNHVSRMGEIDAAVYVAERFITAKAICEHFQFPIDATLLVAIVAELGAESRHVQERHLRA